MKNIGIATLFAVLIIGMPLLPALAQSSTDHHPADQPAATQMSMGGMMDDCQKHCQAASAVLDEITRTIAEAKTSNDVSKLHAALDQCIAQHGNKRKRRIGDRDATNKSGVTER